MGLIGDEQEGEGKWETEAVGYGWERWGEGRKGSGKER